MGVLKYQLEFLKAGAFNNCTMGRDKRYICVNIKINSKHMMWFRYNYLGIKFPGLVSVTTCTNTYPGINRIQVTVQNSAMVQHIGYQIIL